jgi:hypothetical protein
MLSTIVQVIIGGGGLCDRHLARPNGRRVIPSRRRAICPALPYENRSDAVAPPRRIHCLSACGSRSSDGRQIKGGPRIENKSPFRVAAPFASKCSMLEPVHGDFLVWFNQRKAHILAARETLHGRPPGMKPSAAVPVLKS